MSLRATFRQVGCLILWLSFGSALNGYQSAEQPNWDGVTLGSSDYVFENFSQAAAVHVEEGNGWFAAGRYFFRMNLRTGRIEARYVIPEISQSVFQAVAYEKSSDSFLALIGSRKQTEIARFDRTTLQPFELLFSGEDQFTVDHFRLDWYPQVNSRIVLLPGASQLWALHNGRAIRLCKDVDNRYTVTDQFGTVVDLAAICNERIALLSGFGEIEIHTPTGLETIIRRAVRRPSQPKWEVFLDRMRSILEEPDGDPIWLMPGERFLQGLCFHCDYRRLIVALIDLFDDAWPQTEGRLHLNLTYCEAANRLVLADVTSQAWQAFDCESFSRCWELPPSRMSSELLSLDLVPHQNCGVGLSFGGCSSQLRQDSSLASSKTSLGVR